ncbi:alpha/beta fold hydrolase [Aquabacterium sp. J223]|uniref:alpha/beta fold hydrolase n=1 Tax=Aquabacterium sp. J223 TaxID=2898431 RepID=UPI0021ADA42C|nr:alpha/beta hydrolase [Aquabacterium sp. J223]UUX94393.1 alpha/beta hydrolase [Aquabacterium sp. J223]
MNVRVHWDGHDHRIEFEWLAPQRRHRPLLVFLHEGLGSVAMWRDFPARLCDAADCRGLVFSRWGYGQSTPRQPHERWPVDFMHRQASAFLPAFFAALDLDTRAEPPWLYGHSDGGSIALLHAAAFPDRVAGLVVAAPHILVEDLSVASIDKARDAYLATDLRAKLGRYHADPDSAFWGWNDVWLDPAFRDWDIRAALPAIRCPVLAIQGVDDEYGTMAQIEGIAEAVPQAQLLRLDDCGHSPHRDQPQAVLQAVSGLMR